jgi:hypothetical protein
VGSRFLGPCFLSMMGWGRNVADLQSANTSATSTRAVTARVPGVCVFVKKRCPFLARISASHPPHTLEF